MNFSSVSTSDAGYKVKFGDIDIQNFKVYIEPDHCMGKVVEVLRDENQNDYLVVETGTWLSKRELVVPVSQFNLVPTQGKIYLENLILEQNGDHKSYRLVNQPANFSQNGSGLHYREASAAQLPVEVSAPLEASAPLDAVVLTESQFPDASYAEANHLVTTERSHSLQPPEAVPAVGQDPIRLLEERLVIDRHRRKVGEVVVRKEVDTQIIEVPIHRERLVVEQLSPERKQLASIQLGQRIGLHQTEFELSDFNQQTEHTAHNSHPPGISLATAKAVIERMMQSSRFNQANVQLIFTNQELQSQYYQWLLEQDATGSTIR